MDQVIGEISRFQLDLDAVAVSGERAGHDDVAFDPGRSEPENAVGPFELRIEVRFDDLFLAREPRERLLFAQIFDRLLAGDCPVGLASPAGGGERLGVARGDANFVDMLAEPNIRCPAAELGAARDVENSPPMPPTAGNNASASVVKPRVPPASQIPGPRHAAVDRICHTRSHVVEHGVWPNQYRL